MPIRQYLEDLSAFDPDAIKVMSDALQRACKALHINGGIHDRQVVAERIIALARTGVLDANALSSRVVDETKAMQTL